MAKADIAFKQLLRLNDAVLPASRDDAAVRDARVACAQEQLARAEASKFARCEFDRRQSHRGQRHRGGGRHRNRGYRVQTTQRFLLSEGLCSSA